MTTITEKKQDVDPIKDINFFAKTNYRNQERKFGIKTDDRRRHMYIIGKTGMGKSVLLENLATSDVVAGRGMAFVDPHGEAIQTILSNIPSNRINDVVYFNPADIDYPIGFNVMEGSKLTEHRHLVASGLMGVFTKIWEGVWSARMEYILNNAILALLETPGTTLLGIPRLLSDKTYRKKIVSRLTDPVVKSFWQEEYANYNERFRTEAIAPIQNKVGQFLSNAMIRNIVSQSKTKLDVKEIMDTGKILLIDLSKGRIGEDNSALLGAMMITQIQLAAMTRVNMPEEDRRDFFLYVDEFQNFATQSFATILSEARKYRLSLTLAHQYVAQLDDTVRDAIFGNVGTMITFRIGAEDAEDVAKEFAPQFVEQDLVSLSRAHIYLKLMIDGVASEPFSAITLPPVRYDYGNEEKIRKVTRERYSVERSVIEEKILKWSNIEIDTSNKEKDKKQDEITFEKEESIKKNKINFVWPFQIDVKQEKQQMKRKDSEDKREYKEKKDKVENKKSFESSNRVEQSGKNDEMNWPVVKKMFVEAYTGVLFNFINDNQQKIDQRDKSYGFKMIKYCSNLKEELYKKYSGPDKGRGDIDSADLNKIKKLINEIGLFFKDIKQEDELEKIKEILKKLGGSFDVSSRKKQPDNNTEKRPLDHRNKEVRNIKKDNLQSRTQPETLRNRKKEFVRNQSQSSMERDGRSGSNTKKIISNSAQETKSLKNMSSTQEKAKTGQISLNQALQQKPVPFMEPKTVRKNFKDIKNAKKNKILKNNQNTNKEKRHGEVNKGYDSSRTQKKMKDNNKLNKKKQHQTNGVKPGQVVKFDS